MKDQDNTSDDSNEGLHRFDDDYSDYDRINRSKYEEYDSRPIKPLDANIFNKQLEQYAEMSKDELERLKNRLIHFTLKFENDGT